MNMKERKVMFNSYILDHQIKVEDEIIECVQEVMKLLFQIADINKRKWGQRRGER